MSLVPDEGSVQHFASASPDPAFGDHEQVLRLHQAVPEGHPGGQGQGKGQDMQADPVPLENRIQLVTCGSPGSGGARVFIDLAAQDGFPAARSAPGPGVPPDLPGSVQAQPAERDGVAGRGAEHPPA
jgi:hypothetical protein